MNIEEAVWTENPLLEQAAEFLLSPANAFLRAQAQNPAPGESARSTPYPIQCLAIAADAVDAFGPTATKVLQVFEYVFTGKRPPALQTRNEGRATPAAAGGAITAMNNTASTLSFSRETSGETTTTTSTTTSDAAQTPHLRLEDDPTHTENEGGEVVPAPTAGNVDGTNTTDGRPRTFPPLPPSSRPAPGSGLALLLPLSVAAAVDKKTYLHSPSASTFKLGDTRTPTPEGCSCAGASAPNGTQCDMCGLPLQQRAGSGSLLPGLVSSSSGPSEPFYVLEL